MAFKDKMNNAKQAFSDSRSRMIIVILVIIVVAVLGITYFKFKRNKLPPAGLQSSVMRAPSITSIPGMGQPTREYAKLQEQQNAELAAEAARKGTSAIPTVVRTTYLDTGVSSDLSGATSAAGCGVEELKRARAAGVTASELHCRGCSLQALKAAGFTAADLKAAGFSASELKNAGFTADELKAAGFSAKELVAAGFSARELVAAGFTAGELKDAGISAAALRAAGMSEEAIAIAGFASANLSSTGNCSIQKLQEARGRGVSAAALKKLGCSASALRVAGFTAAELKAAGFSAKELKDAGFSTADLRAAGFSAKDLRDAGFSAADLKTAGFSAAELKDAGFSAGEIRNAGFSAAELKDAGFSAKDLRDAGFSAADLKDAGFTPDELKAAGYSDGDLVRAGIVSALVGTGAGTCSVESLKASRKAGNKASDLKKLGCSAQALNAAGFTADELRAAGFNDDELRAAGFNIPKEVKAVDVNVVAKEDCSVDSIKKAKANGFSIAQIKAKGCSLQALKDAGFNASDLIVAGFAPDELRAAGFSASDIKAANLRLSANESMTPEQQKLLGRLTDEQLSNMTTADLENFMRQQQAMMKQQANTLFTAWAQIPSQQYVQGEVPKNAQELTAAEKKERATAAALKDVDVYKAGMVIFAVLDSEVNSDENAPAMATIIHGPLKGSKIIGNFSRVDKKVLLQFSVLSVPKLTNSISVNAVAVDPNTAKTALASSVDNHYMLRYGTMFATSFISGLAGAVQNSGARTDSTQGVGTSTTMPTLDMMQKLLVGLGAVGQQFGAAMAPNINIPPTIKVKAGTSIGLLLMSDLSVPKS